MKRLILSLMMMSLLVLAQAQPITQTIRGQVIDQQTQMPLPGVNVVILETSPPVGTATDLDGYFRLTEVPVGRVSLEVSFLGYEPVVMRNLPLGSGKELVLNVEMQERVITTKEVVISASRDKTKPLNEMATTSARTFSVEESQRFAGARNDVSRMASNFAGVRGADDSVNDIVIRGNSPNGLLWRLEGIDIPNPNHFGEFGGTGGPVSMLNTNVMSNSDFLTGAFPAQYSNALSGVFDLRMRNGNNEKHEFLGQIGFNGFEFGAEGPISRNNKSSYLVNYRYSTLGVLQGLGVDFGTGTAIPYYQDMSFKVNFPMRGKGNISVFGLGGISNIDLISSDVDEEDSENLYTNDDRDVYTKTRSAVVGATMTRILDKKTYLKATLAASQIRNDDIVDSVSAIDRSTYDFYRQDVTNDKLMGSLMLNRKINSRHQVRVGSFFNVLNFQQEDSVFNTIQNRYDLLHDTDGATWLMQPYADWKFRVNENLTINSGLAAQVLGKNNAVSLEPRVGAKWFMTPYQSISFSYGLHSQMAPLSFYEIQARQQDGSYLLPNENLDFTKAHHFVFGYDWTFSETMRLKTEVYYQDIFDAIVEEGSTGYSALNIGSFSNTPPDYLMNGGRGRNYGLEVTLEKFMDKGLYYLVTASLYDSEYQGSDEVWRKTAFAGTYVVNALGGKEFELNKGKENRKIRSSITTDLKMTAAGGQRDTPIDLEASRDAGSTVYVDGADFSTQLSDYFRFDTRVAYRMEGKKYSQEFAFDVQNVTNRQNPFYRRYNSGSGEVETINQLGLFPIVQYKIEF